MDKVKIALVGIAGYGETYSLQLLRALAEDKIDFVGGIDTHPARCGQLKEYESRKIPIYPDLQSFFKNHSSDLVIISTGIHLHQPLTCEALMHGSNVLCEKPLCASMDDANAMLKAQKQAGKFVAIGYQWSFTDAIQSLKKDIMAGILGDPVRLKTKVFWPRPASYYHRNPWAGKIKTPDGKWVLDSPVNNACAHYLHNMFYVLGKTRETSASLKSVQAELYRANPIENYDTAAIRCLTEENTEILFYTAHPVLKNLDPVFEFVFKNAVVEYSKNGSAGIIARFSNGRITEYGNPELTLDNKFWQCVEAVKTGAPVACGISAAMTHTKCITAAQESPAQILSFPEEFVKQNSNPEDPLTFVEGLYEVLDSCYAQNILPAEKGDIPWAKQSRKINL